MSSGRRETTRTRGFAHGIYQATRGGAWGARANGVERDGFTSAVAALSALEDMARAGAPLGGTVTHLSAEDGAAVGGEAASQSPGPDESIAVAALQSFDGDSSAPVEAPELAEATPPTRELRLRPQQLLLGQSADAAEDGEDAHPVVRCTESFTAEEDAAILRGKEAGLSWAQIAREMPGRTGERVRARYRWRLSAANANAPVPTAPAGPAASTGSPPARARGTGARRAQAAAPAASPQRQLVACHPYPKASPTRSTPARPDGTEPPAAAPPASTSAQATAVGDGGGPGPSAVPSEVDGLHLYMSCVSQSGYMGVRYDPMNKDRPRPYPYRAEHRGRNLGYFPTAVDAAVAYARCERAHIAWMMEQGAAQREPGRGEPGRKDDTVRASECAAEIARSAVKDIRGDAREEVAATKRRRAAQ